jgi:hypothetical protein
MKTKIIIFSLIHIISLQHLIARDEIKTSHLPVPMIDSDMIRCSKAWQPDFQKNLKRDYCHRLNGNHFAVS